jgi:sugar phosphate permease
VRDRQGEEDSARLMSGDEQRVPIDGGGGVFDTEDAAQRGGKPKQKEPPKISRGDCFDDGQINNPAAARAEIFDTEAGGSPRKPTTTGVSLEQTPQELRALREEAEAQADEDERTIERWRKTLFVFVCILELLLNMDAGVLPATISHIMTEFGLEYASAGSLGSLVYFGLVLSSPLAGYALTNFRSQRYVMVAAVTLNAAMVFAFALSNNVTLLFVARTLMGFAQAPLFIYAPVWCDEFAPEGQSATWIAILQANVAVGIMLGYMFAGTTTTQWEQPGICKALSEVPLDEAIPDCTIIETGEPGLYYNPHWREPLLVQGVMLVLYVPAMCALKGRYVNARGGKEHCFGYKFEEDMIGSLLSAGWEWLLMTLASLEHHHTGTKHIYDARIGVQERKKHRVKKLMADALLRSHKAAVDRAGAGQRGKPSHLLRDTDRVGSFDLAQDDSEDDDEVALPNDDVLGGDDERYIGDDERIKLRGDINGGGMLRRLRGRDPFTELGKVVGHDGKGAHLSNLMIGESLGMLEMFHGIFHHDDGDNMADAGLKRQLHMMATSKVFVCLTLALSGVYFCVTGMQYWITDYMTQPREQGGIGAEPELVVLCFSIASLTAPTGGVLIGGYIIDRQGGYEDASGAAAARTLRTCAVFGVLSFIFAIPSDSFLRYRSALISGTSTSGYGSCSFGEGRCFRQPPACVSMPCTPISDPSARQSACWSTTYLATALRPFSAVSLRRLLICDGVSGW